MNKHVIQAGSLLIIAAGVFLAVSIASCALPKGIYHRVERGQTFYRICKTYRVDENTVARINRIHDRSDLKVGQRLFIPGANSPRYVPATAISGKTTTSRNRPGRSRSPGKAATGNTDSRTTGTQPVKTAYAKKAPPVVEKGRFIWPVRGTVVKRFGAKGSEVSKGVEIAVPSGSGVRAAAAGKVTYSGNGIAGYGNLVILKHDQSYFTVYGFNKKTLVKMGEYVSKEQRIALSGAPPGGGQPRIHFEIRRGKEALDPLNFLP